MDSSRSLDCLGRQVGDRPLLLVRRGTALIFRNIYQINNLVMGRRKKVAPSVMKRLTKIVNAHDQINSKGNGDLPD
jgi:hypothetical protein